MPYGLEGSSRSGVGLAMRHRLQWFIFGLNDLWKGDEQPAYRPTLL